MEFYDPPAWIVAGANALFAVSIVVATAAKMTAPSVRKTVTSNRSKEFMPAPLVVAAYVSE